MPNGEGMGGARVIVREQYRQLVEMLYPNRDHDYATAINGADAAASVLEPIARALLDHVPVMSNGQFGWEMRCTVFGCPDEWPCPAWREAEKALGD